MGKYFSADSDLTKFTGFEEKPNTVIPSVNNLTDPLPTDSKEKLSTVRQDNIPMTQDDYIDMVRVQADAATQMVNRYSQETKKVMEQQFEKFAPVELFEKLNQIIFTIADLSNRITSLEQKIDHISNGTPIQEKKQPLEITDPEQLYRFQNKLDSLIASKKPESIPVNAQTNNISEDDISGIDINTVRRRLEDARAGNIRKLPDEGLIDESIKLEEVFPDLDDDAYTAAYSAMNQYSKVDRTETSKPEPGTLRNITGF